MEELIQEMVPYLQDAWTTAGWLGILGVGLMFSIRIFRIGPIQNLLAAKAPKLAWTSWPTWAKWGSTFVGTVVGMVLLNVVGGVAWAPAIAAAITAGVLSIGGNAATKKLGKMEGAYKFGKDPGYVPSPFRKGIGFVIPLDDRWKELSPKPLESKLK